MDKFHFLLIIIILLKVLENSYTSYHGNIYGIKKVMGNRSSNSFQQQFWFKRHHVHLTQKYPKTIVFAKGSVRQCSHKKNIKIIKVKRIGGHYPYGPKLSSISKSKICRLVNTGSQSSFPSISFSTSRLKFSQKVVGKPSKSEQISKRSIRKQNKAWCAHCESYWRMKIHSKELKSRHGCC